ncbi:MAG: hypothetical protein WC856_02610 [Methylococcaceae bacterium]|jgi:hypothetical protein
MSTERLQYIYMHVLRSAINLEESMRIDVAEIARLKHRAHRAKFDIADAYEKIAKLEEEIQVSKILDLCRDGR